jgi:hypothetical protein
MENWMIMIKSQILNLTLNIRNLIFLTSGNVT